MKILRETDISAREAVQVVWFWGHFFAKITEVLRKTNISAREAVRLLLVLGTSFCGINGNP